ncbi:MAG: type II toxin-antitoxin system Phd/YefM family antitoxin [Campylobacteraceae bacterium]|jgi:PHD/YefM family antitoxin component YafN of YafNO toxin-antitoxin module|nr:type II toxin-antitoxin system Phd/YefM family antitoxin [Campylobacteraceae bacterium]
MADFYNKEEIFTATQIVRDFSLVLKKIGSNELERVVIAKNGHFRAVMINFEEYEKLKNALSVLQKIYAKTKKTANEKVKNGD